MKVIVKDVNKVKKLDRNSAEIFVSTKDEKLYYKNREGVLIELGGTSTSKSFIAPSYELIGTIDFNDVNDEIGNSNFRELSINYSGKTLESICVKCITALDVDVLSFAPYDTDNASTSGSFVVASNVSGSSQIISAAGLSQTTTSTFEIYCNFSGKGTIVGGNTVGEFEIYAKLVDV